MIYMHKEGKNTKYRLKGTAFSVTFKTRGSEVD